MTSMHRSTSSGSTVTGGGVEKTGIAGNEGRRRRRRRSVGRLGTPGEEDDEGDDEEDDEEDDKEDDRDDEVALLFLLLLSL